MRAVRCRLIRNYPVFSQKFGFCTATNVGSKLRIGGYIEYGDKMYKLSDQCFIEPKELEVDNMIIAGQRLPLTRVWKYEQTPSNIDKRCRRYYTHVAVILISLSALIAMCNGHYMFAFMLFIIIFGLLP